MFLLLLLGAHKECSALHHHAVQDLLLFYTVTVHKDRNLQSITISNKAKSKPVKKRYDIQDTGVIAIFITI